MKEIQLTQGQFAIVDDKDFEWLNQWRWYAQRAGKGSNEFYAARKGRNNQTKKVHTILMHREILNAPKGIQVDHINHNGMYNCRCNLRLCTQAQNTYNSRMNRGRKSSKHKGVYCHKATGKWAAYVGFQNKRIYLGRFDDEIDAAVAYDKKAVELFGEFAYTNFT